MDSIAILALKVSSREGSSEMSDAHLQSANRANTEALLMIMERHEKDSNEYTDALLKIMERQDKGSCETNTKLKKLMLKQSEECQTQKKEILKCIERMGSKQLFNRNLILNPSGKDGLKYWEIKNGGDGIVVEDTPERADPIPDEAGLPHQSCFVTSFSECERMQEVDLKTVGVSSWVMNVLKPRITAVEWVCAREDCDSWTELAITLLNDQEVVATKSLHWSSKDCGAVKGKWYKYNYSGLAIEMRFHNLFTFYVSNTYLPTFILLIIGYLTFHFPLNAFNERIMVALTALLVEAALFTQIEVELCDYPEGVTTIKYLSNGKDHQFWKGHYGTKSAGSAIHLCM